MKAKLSSYLGLIQEFARHPHNKSTLRQCLEIVLLFVRSRLGPGYYLRGQMYRNDTAFGDVMGYVSTSTYYKTVNQLNHRLYQRCAQNKVVEKALLTAYGQPTPKLLGYYHETRGLTTDGHSLRDRNELMELIKVQAEGTRLCFKRTNSWGGQGFQAIECRLNRQVLVFKDNSLTNTSVFIESLEDARKEGLLIERYLDQHPDYAAMNNTSVNTVRVLVKNDAGGVPRSLCAFLRVGRAGSLVDNGEAGGLIFPIDMATGVLDRGMSIQTYGDFYATHPDSGLQMEGRKLWGFAEALRLSETVLQIYPEINFAGTDIAFSKDGPVVIEVNALPSYIDFAIARTPSRKALA